MDDLLDRIVAVSKGEARRIVVNLARAAERAATEGTDRIGLATFGEARFFTGRPPSRVAA